MKTNRGFERARDLASRSPTRSGFCNAKVLLMYGTFPARISVLSDRARIKIQQRAVSTGRLNLVVQKGLYYFDSLWNQSYD